jgi:hypothetical protein
MPTCGAQQPSGLPDSFDWWPIGAVATIAAVGTAVYTGGIPGINSILVALGYLPVGTALGPAFLLSAFAGAAAILALVLYYALKPDGCIRSLPKGQPVCFSGIVQDTADTSSTAVSILAPFAIPPAGLFNVVVKSFYWNLVEQNAHWVYCSPAGSAMLPCIVKSETACGGKIGSVAGAAVGAIAGIVLGYVAAAALGCAASGPFYPLCLLAALLIALIVAAAVTYGGAMVGGWIGEGIGSVGEDPVGDTFQGIEKGAIVTVKGNWVTNSDIGNNEIFFVTELSATGQVDAKAAYTTEDADATAPDDCPLVPDPVE